MIIKFNVNDYSDDLNFLKNFIKLENILVY